MERLNEYVALKIFTTGLDPERDHIVYLAYGIFVETEYFFTFCYYLKNDLSEEEIAFLEKFYPELYQDYNDGPKVSLEAFSEIFKGLPIVTTHALLTKKFLAASAPEFGSMTFYDLLDIERDVLKDERKRSYYYEKLNEIKTSFDDSRGMSGGQINLIKQQYELLHSLLDMDETRMIDLKNKRVSLTGRLAKMTRAVAANYIRSMGGIFFHNVTKETDILVVADNAAEESTNKKSTFLNYQKEDPRKRIIDEDTFYKIIGI